MTDRIGRYRISMTDPSHHEPRRVKIVNGKSFAVRADFVVLGYVEARSLKDANRKAKEMNQKASAEFIRLV